MDHTEGYRNNRKFEKKRIEGFKSFTESFIIMAQPTQAEHIEQLADYLEEFDIDKFTATHSGKRYGEPFSLKKSAPTDISKSYSKTYALSPDEDGTPICSENPLYKDRPHVTRVSHPEAVYLAQLVAKEYKVPIHIRSISTALEASEVDKCILFNMELNSNIILKDGWTITYPKVFAKEGRLEYDINSSAKIVRGKTIIEKIEGGTKVKINNDNVFKTLGIKTKVKVSTAGIDFGDPRYKNIAFVVSDTDEGVFGAAGFQPCHQYAAGLIIPELVEKA